jgi:predicted GNAT family N-acyltransferase
MSIIIDKPSTHELDEAFKIRQQVFVEEQCVDPEEEYDEYENSSIHYLAKVDGTPAGTARWRHIGDKIKLERFAVLKEFRGRHIGFGLLEAVLADVIPLQKPIYLHAQLQVIPFYEKAGFYTEGDIFTEAGIEHKVMKYKVGI